MNRRTIPVHQRRCCVHVGVEKLVALHFQRAICLALNQAAVDDGLGASSRPVPMSADKLGSATESIAGP